jgi:hypothetical protein
MMNKFTRDEAVLQPFEYYMLEDLAFENSWFIVAAYRMPAGVCISHEHRVFYPCN